LDFTKRLLLFHQLPPGTQLANQSLAPSIVCDFRQHAKCFEKRGASVSQPRAGCQELGELQQVEDTNPDDDFACGDAGNSGVGHFDVDRRSGRGLSNCLAKALRGLGDWLDSAGPSDVPAAYRTPSASIATSAPNETTFNDIIASIYTVNGEANNLTLIAGVALRKVISNFTRSSGAASSEAVYTVNQDASAKKVTHSVTLYESDFGIVNVINGNPACMPNANRGYVVNPKYLGFNTLIPMGSTRLENQGGGERGFVDMVGTLVCKHPGAHGKIAY